MHCIIRKNGLTYVCPYDDVGVIDEVKEVYQEPQRGDVVLDVGAHYGFYAMYASKKVGETGKIYAFEPCPASFKHLLLNLRINRLYNVQPVQKALSNFDGIGKLYYGIYPRTNTLQETCLGYEKIQITRLDTLAKTLSFRKIGCVKIDVEGHEMQVLEGAEKTLQRYRPRLSIASYHYESEAKQIKTWLQRLGYTVDIVEFTNIPRYNVYVYAI